MISYAERGGLFGEEAMRGFDDAKGYVHQFPHLDLMGREIRCHEVVRAVARLMRNPTLWFVMDGKYGPVEHSWLEMPPAMKPIREHGKSYLVPTDKVILDVYAVGRLPQVQIVSDALKLGSLYKYEGPRGDIREDVVEYLVNVVRRSCMWCGTVWAPEDELKAPWKNERCCGICAEQE